MPSSYQVVLWKQESFVVLRPLQIEFFRNLLERAGPGVKLRFDFINSPVFGYAGMDEGPCVWPRSD